ncbi:MAG: UpxY family transcription antiterminator [Terracidiphilus sp.]|jgi:transcription antitermination factor NusG
MSLNLVVEPHAQDSFWFAVFTRSRQEKVAGTMLKALDVQHFLPLKTETRQWSDRKQAVTVPLFDGYLFVRIKPTNENRLRVLKTPGVGGFVGNHSGPLPIPDQEINDIRTVLTQRLECKVLPFIEEGDHVRVVRGPLAGVEGLLVRSNSTSRLTISIEVIRKSITVNVSRDDVEFVGRGPSPGIQFRETSGSQMIRWSYPVRGVVDR